MKTLDLESIKICVVGLGYVGFPLARLFATKFPTVGFDINSMRVKELNSCHDSRLEVPDHIIAEALTKNKLRLTSDMEEIKDCNFYVIAVPTPVGEKSVPNLDPLLGSSEIVGKVLKSGDIVVYESTVYPGVTEDCCIPVVEKVSGLKLNEDFFCGYSPERVNPGDRLHTVETIKKVTSGSTLESADIIDKVYGAVLVNGTHKAPSIKVAEASKVIENCQRDVNIAFFNEIAKIFNALGIDTEDVIDAASSKWNFVRLKPGLVGGHCISVDPYYLIQKSVECGLEPQLLISARETNESMGNYIAMRTIDLMNKKGVMVKDSHILVLGFTFKENCPDLRNTKVANVCVTFNEYTTNVDVVDPWAYRDEAMQDYGIEIKPLDTDCMRRRYDAVVLTVAHREFIGLDVRTFLKDPTNGVVFDVKGILSKDMIDGRL